MSNKKIKLSKSQYKFLYQLREYVETEDIFNKKNSIDVLSYEDVPGIEYHPSKMGVRYELKPKMFKAGLDTVLKDKEYNEIQKKGLMIVRKYCEDRMYPFHNFKYDPHKKINKT